MSDVRRVRASVGISGEVVVDGRGVAALVVFPSDGETVDDVETRVRLALAAESIPPGMLLSAGSTYLLSVKIPERLIEAHREHPMAFNPEG